MRLLRIGDRVLYQAAEHQVVAVSGSWVRLFAAGQPSSAVLLTPRVGSDGFEILDGDTVPVVPDLVQDLADVPAGAAAHAGEWERHVVEVETGLPPGAPPGATPRPAYDPAERSVREREAAKAAELTEAGTPTSAITVQRRRRRYRAEGLRGLVDRRSLRPSRPEGNADPRLVEAIREALAAETGRSTGTRDRLRRQVTGILAARHGAGAVALPAKAVFPRGGGPFSGGRDPLGTAPPPRVCAKRAGEPFPGDGGE